MWKFAAVCQFLFVFDEAFGMSGFETEALEADFEDSETNVVPDLIKRLLYTLTLDRTIDFDNWQHHLRVQYDLRDVDANSRFGTSEQPIAWAHLSLEDKIATLHDLCEWQLMDPERFRKLVKSEEDITTWRVSPIGWDAHDNAYWLFDDNRIWIQRPQPQPKPAVKPRAPAKKGSKRARLEAAAARRAAATNAKPSPASKSGGTNKRSRPSDATPTSTPSKRTRSSLADSAASTPSRPPPRRGTRTSARFAPHEDEGTNTPSNGRASRSAAASYSSDSELSEPPETLEGDDDEQDAANTKGEDGNDVKMEDVEAGDVKEEQAEEGEDSKAQQDDDEEDDKADVDEVHAEDEWVEFKAIVVTRQEWLDFAKRFAKSKDPNEKNLHQFINKEILDQVLAALNEIDRQRALELALANRKRSSRIALKESEREERERDREARARMEEKMALIRKEEEQKRQREEEEQETQRSRETRLREREERLRARELEIETKAIREEEERERKEKEREERIRRREEIIANGGIPPPSKDSTPVPQDASTAANGAVDGGDEEEEWELNCEVCGKAAISPPDEDDEIVCCEQCGVWQHIKCWDSFDKQILGLKKKRDWESEDFFCSKCRPPAAGTPVPHPGILSRRDKSSPLSKKRSSNGSESPSRKADGTAAAANGSADSPRQRIKLVSGAKDAEASKVPESSQRNPPTDSVGNGLVEPPTIPSQSLRPPTAGAQPAETGTLSSSGTAPRLVHAIAGTGQLPPPSSHAVPDGGNAASPSIGRPLLPAANVSAHGVGDASKAANGSTSATAPSQSGSGLGMGRPTQTPQFSAIGSPGSPSSSGAESSTGTAAQGNGATALSPRSPSYGATLASPAYRRPSQPSGSFPMRHMPAKSPLSRPYAPPSQNGDPPANGFSLPPPRADSPSADRGSGHFASLSETAQTLHRSSAAAAATATTTAAAPEVNVAAAPAAAPGAQPVSSLENVFGRVFAPASSGAAVPGAATIAPPSDAAPAVPGTLLGSASRLQPPVTVSGGSGVEVAAPSVDGGGALGDDGKKMHTAAANAMRTLELGVPSSPVAGLAEKSEHKPEAGPAAAAAEAKLVELPPTHIQSP
ncbi:hypothetical protein EX895_003432 [Sporisorium graminicola]|uniref:PHD-type domain-containing protein n=1 Tax=Sporisorium graminicola TaxID=280036 RepID=A0A4U7KTJ5_9BASI|nr:hypothetical protein EX895_003432 [Sporisorium graminicola]TKY87851.1 hypothetical protein EX895_003432 [Sporisorium graminicola]